MVLIILYIETKDFGLGFGFPNWFYYLTYMVSVKIKEVWFENDKLILRK